MMGRNFKFQSSVPFPGDVSTAYADFLYRTNLKLCFAINLSMRRMNGVMSVDYVESY
jgi:hypothetical protein